MGQFTFSDFEMNAIRTKPVFQVKTADFSDEIKPLFYGAGLLSGTVYLKTLLSYFFDLDESRIHYLNKNSDLLLSILIGGIENEKRVVPGKISDLLNFRIKERSVEKMVYQLVINKNSQLQPCEVLSFNDFEDDRSFALCHPISWIIRHITKETGELIVDNSSVIGSLFRFSLPATEAPKTMDFYEKWFKKEHNIEIVYGNSKVKMIEIEFL